MEPIRLLISQAIQGTIFESVTYFAGGCVRDYLLGRTTIDFDLTVELPQGGSRLAEHLYALGICSMPIVYKYFGTAKVNVGQHQLEFVMTRREIYHPKSRYPAVRFASLTEDVMRRDFTINALLMRVGDGEILDLSGLGKADIADKLIRTLKDPTKSFTEDPLRMLRAVRFAVALGFMLEPQTRLALINCAPEIHTLSSRTYAQEIARIYASGDSPASEQLLKNWGLLRD